MAAYLVCFLLFILYLIVIPIGVSPFETPKVILAEIVIAGLLFLKITHFKKVDFKHLFTPQLVLIGILFILSLDQLLLFHPKGGFFGNVFRLQGVFLLWHLMVFSLLSKDVKIDHFLKILLPFSFICLLMGTLILGVDQNNRAFGTLGEPNALAATALFLFPFVYFRYKPVVKTGAFFAALLITILSGSRAGLIGFILELIFIVGIKISTPAKALSVCLLLMLSSLLLPLIENVGWFEKRAEIWQTALISGWESPLIGHGFGNVQNSILQTAVKLGNNVQYQIVDSSHNFLLDYWIQGGVVAVISILLLLILSLQGLSLHKKVVEMTAMVGLLTAMLFNPVSVVNLLAFWWLIGQGFSRD